MKELRETLKRLEAERDSILEKSKTLHEQRAAVVAKIQPLEVELRGVDKAIKTIEQPRLAELGRTIAAVHRALGAKTLKNDG